MTAEDRVNWPLPSGMDGSDGYVYDDSDGYEVAMDRYMMEARRAARAKAAKKV